MIIIHCQTGRDVEIKSDTLENLVLDGLDLHRAVLEGLNLTGTRLRKANLRGALMFHANLVKADLTEAQCMTADFRFADLRNCKLNKSAPIFANFSETNLQSASLAQADIFGAVFKGSNLKGTVMLCHRLEEASLEGAIFDKNTVWPDGYEPEKHGAIRINY